MNKTIIYHRHKIFRIILCKYGKHHIIRNLIESCDLYLLNKYIRKFKDKKFNQSNYIELILEFPKTKLYTKIDIYWFHDKKTLPFIRKQFPFNYFKIILRIMSEVSDIYTIDSYVKLFLYDKTIFEVYTQKLKKNNYIVFDIIIELNDIFLTKSLLKLLGFTNLKIFTMFLENENY